MVDQIEIRSCGEIRANYARIGRVEFETPFPMEFAGDWFSEDPSAIRNGEIDDLNGEIDGLSDELDDLKSKLSEAEVVEGEFNALRDEVRALLASGETGAEAIGRLSDALSAAE